MNLKFKNDSFNEIDIKLLDKILSQLKQETTHSADDFYKLKYNCGNLVLEYNEKDIESSLANLFELSIIKQSDNRITPERLVLEYSYQNKIATLLFCNILYLKRHYYVVYKNSSNTTL